MWNVKHGKSEPNKWKSHKQGAFFVILFGKHYVQSEDEHIGESLFLDRKDKKSEDKHRNFLILFIEIEQPQKQRQDKAILVEIVNTAVADGRISDKSRCKEHFHCIAEVIFFHYQQQRNNTAE